jgi:peptidoglycan/xylan/chitin deacetylase (PgdA/CDA1 family)
MIYLLPLTFFLSLNAMALNCSFKSHEALGQLALAQVQTMNCSTPKRIHLTFDDGPHGTYTPQLLQELNRRNVRSTFFISTTNIAPGKETQRNIVKSIMDSGHTLGSHGHRHEAYDLRLNSQGTPVSESLTEEERVREIRLSTQYLNEATNNRYGRQRPLLFRFPYGRGALPSDRELEEMERRNEIRFTSQDRTIRLREYRRLSSPLHAVATEGYGHLLWNHDSMDSSSSAPTNSPQSKSEFIVRNLRNFCSSSHRDIVSLFHDIKSFNPEVIAVLIDLAQCLGLSFVDAPTILSASSLQNNGTYLSQETIQGEPVKHMDEIAKLLKNIGPDCEQHEPTPGSCYSESLNRFFGDCEGGSVSICIRGSWYSRTPAKEAECRARGFNP